MEDFNFTEAIQGKQLDFYSACVLIPTPCLTSLGSAVVSTQHGEFCHVHEWLDGHHRGCRLKHN